jgi:hypothetical protein
MARTRGRHAGLAPDELPTADNCEFARLVAGDIV